MILQAQQEVLVGGQCQLQMRAAHPRSCNRRTISADPGTSRSGKRYSSSTVCGCFENSLARGTVNVWIRGKFGRNGMAVEERQQILLNGMFRQVDFEAVLTADESEDSSLLSRAATALHQGAFHHDRLRRAIRFAANGQRSGSASGRGRRAGTAFGPGAVFYSAASHGPPRRAACTPRCDETVSVFPVSSQSSGMTSGKSIMVSRPPTKFTFRSGSR